MNKNCSIIILSLFILMACVDEKPYVNLNVSDIYYVTPTSGLVIVNVDEIEGGANIWEAGVEFYKKDRGTTTEKIKGKMLSGKEFYNTGLSGLEPDTKYIVAPYADTDEGIFYGDTVSFTTNAVQYLTDERDQQKYMIHAYGFDTWMIENLNYYTEESYYYENDSTSYHQFGRLYTYTEAENVCPQGWHLPTRDDWENLVGSIADSDSVAGKMLSPGTRYWREAGSNAFTNQSRFSILPAGIGQLENGSTEFSGTGDKTIFWSQMADNGLTYCRFFSDHDHRAFVLESKPDGHGLYSIRCVKD